MSECGDFYITTGPWPLSYIAEKTGCVISDEDKRGVVIDGIKALDLANSKELSFLSNKKYLSDFIKSAAGAVIVPFDLAEESVQDKILLRSKNPYYAYACALDLFYAAKRPKPAIMPSAYISPSAHIGENCFIGHNVYIGDEAEIGADSVIEAGCMIGANVRIGARARVDANVTIVHSVIGDDVVILSGARIGQDGFGFATNAGVHKKIYHIGRVVIGNDVEIGANSCIDRGSLGDTIIEDYCRIDNLVQIGHNARIKRGAILVSQVGIAGSSTIGAYAALGGQVGVAGHLNIADQVQIVAQSGVAKDIEQPRVIFAGTPAIPVQQWHRQTIFLKNAIKKRDE